MRRTIRVSDNLSLDNPWVRQIISQTFHFSGISFLRHFISQAFHEMSLQGVGRPFTGAAGARRVDAARLIVQQDLHFHVHGI